MKEKIYTIPVNDAFNTPCECPMCELDKKTTSDLLSYFMGASMMESDVRMVTNEKGFCKEHFSAMYNRQENRLGLGLMLHTNLVDINKDIKSILKKAGPKESGNKLFSFRSDFKSDLLEGAAKIESRAQKCTLCDRLDYTMDRYIDVILWQFFEEKTFRKKFEDSNGFCLPHTAMLMRGCAKYLTQNQASYFMEKLSEIQNKSLLKLEEELLWFTQKFDYKNEGKPWGNSKDAVPRTIRKTIGKADLKQ